ncbi:MAG: response regulator transcription factor [Campylobacterota bacterium]|nr:response regulator transcription factor [Campylobacterota bacterium]
MKILLLEDELMLQNSIAEYLDALGHECTAVGDGLKAKNTLQTKKYDLLIFDINVPHISGLELLEHLHHKHCYTPVIFISALVDIKSITEAFNLGAADYLKKPFHLKELALRVQKISKDIDDLKRQHILISPNYSYVKHGSQLLFNKQLQPLTKKQNDIVECLCNNIGTIISVDILREYVWNSEPVSDATIRTEISRLRRVLKEDFIQNHKGIGYKIDRYVASV